MDGRIEKRLVLACRVSCQAVVEIKAWVGCACLGVLVWLSPLLLEPVPLAALITHPGALVEVYREARVLAVEGKDRIVVIARGHGGVRFGARWPGHPATGGEPIALKGRVVAPGEIEVIEARLSPRRWVKILVSIPGAMIGAILFLGEYRLTGRGFRRRPRPRPEVPCRT